MKRRPKPEPVLVESQRPPCGFEWKVDEDGELYCDGCACGLPYSDHPRYRDAMSRALATEVGIDQMRKHVARALVQRVPVNERMWPLKTRMLHEKGHRRRYLIDSEAIGGPADQSE